MISVWRGPAERASARLIVRKPEAAKHLVEISIRRRASDEKFDLSPRLRYNHAYFIIIEG
jgi:hypothetical protein